MGCWKNKRTGHWYYEFKFQKVKYGKYGFPTKAEAQAAEAKEKERRKQTQTRMEFSEIGIKRLDFVKAYCTPTHYRDTKTMLRRFKDWGDLFIDSITPDMIRERLIKLSQELGNHNANRHLTALKATFSLIVPEFLNRNPCVGIPKFPVTKAVKYIPPKEDVTLTLLQAKPLDRAYLEVIWRTGARVGEINRLTWEDVNFEGRKVRLWTRKKKGGHLTPRLVHMNDRVYSALEYAWKHREKRSPWVFTNTLMIKKYPDSPDRWRYIYRDKFIKTIFRNAGIKAFGYHNLRHQTASELAVNQTELVAIKNILGHESVTTTNIYLQSIRGMEVAALDALDKSADGFSFKVYN